MATDPLAPEIDQWLRSLQPRQELVVRFALRAQYPTVRAGRAFDARVNELRDSLKLDEDRLATIVADARLVGQNIEKLIGGPTTKRK